MQIYYYILIYKLGSISLVVVFYLALQLVACDTGSFQSRLHERVQFTLNSTTERVDVTHSL